jgi:inner membrane protein
MPTVATHALAGAGLGVLVAGPDVPPGFHLLTACLGMAPDLDVLAFRLGIPYGSRFGHRGFSHSFICAALLSLLATALAVWWAGEPWWRMAGIFFVVVVSHSVLDAMTDGGMGVAFFSPFNDRRYFLPWRPIRVSPIGWAAFSRWGLRALLSEILLVWLPVGSLVAARLTYARVS